MKWWQETSLSKEEEKQLSGWTVDCSLQQPTVGLDSRLLKPNSRLLKAKSHFCLSFVSKRIYYLSNGNMLSLSYKNTFYKPWNTSFLNHLLSLIFLSSKGIESLIYKEKFDLSKSVFILWSNIYITLVWGSIVYCNHLVLLFIGVSHQNSFYKTLVRGFLIVSKIGFLWVIVVWITTSVWVLCV